MKVLILGCGYTGTRLARFLIEQNIAVNATTRNGKSPAEAAIATFPFAGDQSLPSAAWDGVTHVLNSIPPNDAGEDPVVKCLLQDLIQAKVQWFGYLSTTGVYGDTQGAWVDETSPVNPQTARSQHRVTTERAFLEAPIPAHIFRLPGIYGSGRSVFERLKAGQSERVEKPGHVFCRIHVDDIVQTLWASMQQPQPGNIYNVCDDEPTESGDLYVEAAHLLEIEPIPAVPFTPEKMRSPMAVSFWQECRRVSNQKIKRDLGVKLYYPTYREGLRAILEESAIALSH